MTAGEVYWKTGDYKFNGLHHPAFGEMWAAIPLALSQAALPLNHPAWKRGRWDPYDQYQFADAFLYQNQISHERILFLSRLAQVFLSLLFTLFLFWAGRIAAGPLAGLLTAGFWALSPTALAHGTLVSTDLSFAVFFFAFFFALSRFKEKPWGLLTGLFLGLALASKYPAFIIGPLLAVGLTLQFLAAGGASQPKKAVDSVLEGFTAKRMAAALGIAALVLLVIYRFTELEVFWKGLSRIIARSQTGRSSFLLGEHSTTGWLTYFPITFLYKTSIPVLAAAGLALFAWKKSGNKVNWILTAPPILYFLLACFSKVQIGHRHILLIYPFLFYFIGTQLGGEEKKPKLRMTGVFFLLGLGILSSVVRPDFLSFFNLAVGGGKAGHHYLSDSNVDWGQGLKTLGEKIRADYGGQPIYLSYFGVADPAAYGITYIDVGSDRITGRSDNRSTLTVRPTLFAISATNYTATYYGQKTVFDWLKNRTPVAVFHESVFLYDFSNDPEALKILEIYSTPQPAAQ